MSGKYLATYEAAMTITHNALEIAPQKATVLVIDDDHLVSRTIARTLQKYELNVITANGGEQGLALARQQHPDIAILDVLMPKMDGIAVCRRMRQDAHLRHIPILFLTARTKVEERIECFLAGGDDYLAKPFSLEELRLRVQAILKRMASLSAPSRHEVSDNDAKGCLKAGGFILNTRTYELSTPNRGTVRLSPRQYELLYHLMSHPGEAFSTTRLLDEIWDYPSERGSPDLVRMHIKALRERVEVNPKSPHFIITIPGKGYTIHTPPIEKLSV